MWSNFQKETNGFVNNPINGGNADPVFESDNSINRPDWEKVKEVLEETRPISDLGC